MKRLIKIFAIWLIAIAIPVQGLASVAMLNCVQSPSHHSQDVAADHHHESHSDQSLSDTHAHDTANVGDHATHSSEKTKHACAHCVKCTSCCSGFTFQSTASNLFQQLNVNQARYNDRTLPFTGFIPSGLERPPRFTLI